MDPMAILTWFMVTAALFGILGGAALFLTSGEGRVTSRVQQYVAADAPATTAAVSVQQKRKRAELFSQLDERWEKRSGGQILAKELERAALPMTITEFSLLRLGVAVGLAVILMLIFPGFWWIAWLPGLLIGQFLPRFYLRRRARNRLNKLDRQLADILNILAGSVRTGNSLFQALERVAREAEEPSKSEFMRVTRSISLGQPLDEALRSLAERIPTEDMDMLVTAVSIQQQTGGNLGHILDLIATTVRERHRIMREIEVLSAQQRLSAVLLALLPVGMTGMLFLINPNYIGRIFEPGIILVLPCSVVVLLIVGFIVMNKIATIEV